MPVTKSAKKALRVSTRRKTENDKTRKNIRGALKAIRTEPNLENLKKVYSVIDKAVKNKIMHANKAARLKSGLSKLVSPPKAGKKK